MLALLVADVVRLKESFIQVGGATDKLADELDAAARELGAPSFAIHEGQLWSFAKVYGNPWNTHDVLASLCRLSSRVPDRSFEVSLDPDGSEGTLRSGELLGIPVAPL